MTAHHDRVRAVLFVHGLEAEHRSDAGGDDDPMRRLTARVTRIQGLLDKVRSVATASPISDQRHDVDTGADADVWMLAVYDAALVELCGALGLSQSLVDDTGAPEGERQGVELELLSSVLPLG